MRTLALVLRSGGDFDQEWVKALLRGLRDTTPTLPTITVLTDVLGPLAGLEGVQTHPLVEQWPGWWAKLELFRPGLFQGPVLYLDLDTLPVADLTLLLEWMDPGFYTLRDFYRANLAATGVMAWTPGKESTALHWNVVNTIRRDGIPSGRMDRFLQSQGFRPDGYLQDEFPDQIVSFKPIPGQPITAPPVGARLVCGHGRPRFTERRAGWAHQLWTKRRDSYGA